MAVTDAALAFDALTIDMSRLVRIMHLLHSDTDQEWTSEQIDTFGELITTRWPMPTRHGPRWWPILARSS